LPLDFTTKLIPILGQRGISLKEIYALAGLNITGELPLSSIPNAKTSCYEDSVKIEEIDLRKAVSLSHRAARRSDTGGYPVISFVVVVRHRKPN